MGNYKLMNTYTLRRTAMHVVCCIQFVLQCFLNIKVFDKLMKDAQSIKCRMLFNSAKT